MAIIGIDLGTTNSLVSVYRNGHAELLPNEWGEFMTPSCVGVLEDGTVTVGAVAKERLITHPEETAASFKTWMGTQKEYILGGRRFLPQELSALVLRKLAQNAREALGEEIEEAIISVPAYFNDNQRCATRLAAQLAGLPVKRLINEPSAAALYYSQSRAQSECRLLVIDFGGGTLDVTVVDCFENMVEIVAIAGNNHLGGNDIDQAIAGYFCSQTGLVWSTLGPQQQRQLLALAERGKIALSSAGERGCLLACEIGPELYSVPLDSHTLSGICQPVFQKVREVIVRAVRDSEIPISAIQDVVLVGGSSQLGVFMDYLEELFSRRPTLAEHPEHTVALGVGMYAGIKQRDEDLREIVMTDVCPFSLGVASYNDLQDLNPHMATLIQRSSILPARRTERFYTLSPNQRRIRLEIYQGENYYASENLRLGELTVSVPPDAPGKQFASVTFAYDINGILEVTAQSSGGDIRRTVILNPQLNWSEEEIRQALERLNALPDPARSDEEDLWLLSRAERLFAELSDSRRAEAAAIIQCLQEAMQSGSPTRLARERERQREHLEELERWAQRDIWDDFDGQ
mgnify:FL=1